MIGAPASTNGAAIIATAAAAQAASASQPRRSARAVPLSVHGMPASAQNQTSTDRSTCTTSATRKKSGRSNSRFSPGVRDATSSTENSPDASSAASASPSQPRASAARSEEHTSELQSPLNLVCRLLLEKKKNNKKKIRDKRIE